MVFVPPTLTHDNAFFWEAVKERKLVCQQCAECDMLRHPPSPTCPNCHSFRWFENASVGKGVLYSYVVHHHPKIPPYEPPYAVGLVELEEGWRLVAGLREADISSLFVGMRVTVDFISSEEVTIPFFRPTAQLNINGR